MLGPSVRDRTASGAASELSFSQSHDSSISRVSGDSRVCTGSVCGSEWESLNAEAAKLFQEGEYADAVLVGQKAAIDHAGSENLTKSFPEILTTCR
jgi:hypothetical protein